MRRARRRGSDAVLRSIRKCVGAHVRRRLSKADIGSLDWNKSGGRLPVIVQDWRTGQILMAAVMNRAALARTLASKRVTFFSRTRGRLWTKGETSGNWLQLKEVRKDCDSDALLVLAEPKGPTCHTGERSCFGDYGAYGPAFLGRLAEVIRSRRGASPRTSYTARLLEGGPTRPGRKVREEAAELVRAAQSESDSRVVSEAADLLYHVLVLLESRDVSLDSVCRELKRRAEHPK